MNIIIKSMKVAKRCEAKRRPNNNIVAFINVIIVITERASNAKGIMRKEIRITLPPLLTSLSLLNDSMRLEYKRYAVQKDPDIIVVIINIITQTWYALNY